MSFQRGYRPNKGGFKKRGEGNSRPYRKNFKRQQPAARGKASIHPSRFINRAKPKAQEKPYEPDNSFADLPFDERLHKNIRFKGYETPSAIQDQAINPILNGKDVIGLANTGTGKTAAFLLPIINKLLGDGLQGSVVILAPTRELAQQIDEQFRVFSYDMRLYSALLVGGVNMGRQISRLRRGPHVVIGTPGRVMDMIRREQLNLQNVDTVVLDEADRMLDMGFVNDIRTIVGQMPGTRQTLFFSATITPEIQKLTSEFLEEPVTISVRTADTSESVDQDVVFVAKEDRMQRLIDLLNQSDFEKVLLFGETKRGVQRLSDNLEKTGLASVAIHGDKSQGQRQRALRSFRNDEVNIMVATDVAARGLDIPNVTHVINYDQPQTYEDYVHRIGRTGRGGATGKALTFMEPR